MMGTEAVFDKYIQDGAYHWIQVDHGWRNPRYNPPLVARYQALIDLLPSQTQAILEVGCGDGCLLYLAGQARPSAELHGVEYEAVGVQLAQAQLTQHGSHAEIRQGSAYELPYSDERFDVLLMADVIEHLEQPEQAVREARRVLRPGGLLLLSTPHRQPDFVWDPPHHVHEYDGQELRNLLAQHFASVNLSACYPMPWMRLWRRNSVLRFGIRCLSRIGYNPLCQGHPQPSVEYGQILAACRA